MPTYRGQFRYGSGTASAPEQGGGCQVQFDNQIFSLTPDAGVPLVFDLGDIDAVSPADYAIRLTSFTGATVTLDKFGKSYEDLSRELVEGHRTRTLECLLLVDLQPIDRFSGEVALDEAGRAGASSPGEVRIFKSNLAVLPSAGQPFQWRLADVDALHFDGDHYEIRLEAGNRALRIARLGKRTELCHTTLGHAINALNTESAAALHGVLPFLNADELRETATVLREGRSASMHRLAGIHSRIPKVLAANAVDEGLQPYYDDLVSRSAQELSYAGFKLIRSESQDSPGSGEDDDGAEGAVLYWFFFPIAVSPGSGQPRNVVAWEASSRAGRATYFFRLLDPSQAAMLSDPAQAPAAVERGIGELTRALGLLSYRRRPIYVSDDELTGLASFHRYAIAARRMPEVRHVRAAFLGRAIHSSLDAWRTQVNEILDVR